MAKSQLLNEIMPMIYKRFTDKTAEEWRQIYKVRDGHRVGRSSFPGGLTERRPCSSSSF